MSQYPHIRDYFEKHKAIDVIQSSVEKLDLAQKASLYDFGQDYDPDTLDELLSNSRKALISVQDTELNRLAKRLVVWHPLSIGDASAGTPCEKELLRLEREWDAHGEAFLKYLTLVKFSRDADPGSNAPHLAIQNFPSSRSDISTTASSSTHSYTISCAGAKFARRCSKNSSRWLSG